MATRLPLCLGSNGIVQQTASGDTLIGITSVNQQLGTTYTFVQTDGGKLVTFSNSSAVAVTLPQATSPLGTGWFTHVQNTGTGTVTITPTTSTIDGLSSIVLTTGQGIYLISNGTNYFSFRGAYGFAPTSSPAFTGVPTAPTATVGTNTTQISTTAFVQAALPPGLRSGSGGPSSGTGNISDFYFDYTNNLLYGPKTSGGWNGGVLIATTSISSGQISDATSIGVGLLTASSTSTALSSINGAPLASPAFTGVPTAPTATAGTNNTQISTTAFVQAALPPGLRNGSGAPSVLVGNINDFYVDTTSNLLYGPKTSGGWGGGAQLGASNVTSNMITDATTSGKALLTATNPSASNVYFAQTGTGAVTRAVTSKLKENISVRDFGAAGNTITVNGTVTLAAGSPSLTVAGASFVSTDIGKAIVIPGAGVSGNALVSTITAFISTTSVTLADNATTAVSTSQTIVYGTDDTTSIQNAINYLISIGGKLIVPAGDYFINPTGLTAIMTNTGDAANNRISIEGDGSGCTMFYYAGTNSVLTIEGVSSNFITYFKVSGLHFYSAVNQKPTSLIGLGIIYAAWFEVNDILIEGFYYGVLGYDILSSSFHRLNTRWNWCGFAASRLSLSDPNAITFDSCEFGQNVIYGAALADTTTVNFIGGAFEENGIYGNSGSGGLLLSSNNSIMIDGGAGATLHGVYFEGNGGLSDVNISAGGTDGSTSFLIQGCTFNRLSNATNAFTTNNISLLVGSTTTSKIKLTVLGCGFQQFATYVASSSRPYINILNPNAGAKWNFSDGGGSNMYGNSVEKPTLNNIAPVKTDAALLSAAVVFNGSLGVITNYILNVSSLTRNTAGDYTITFGTPLAFGSYGVAISLGAPGVAIVFSPATTSLRIQTYNLAGTVTDFAYVAISCYGGGDIT